MPPRRRPTVETSYRQENCASSYPDPPIPVLLIGDAGSGIEYIAAVLRACPRVVVADKAFSSDAGARLAAVAAMVAEPEDTTYVLPDPIRNCRQTWTQINRETAGTWQATVLMADMATAEAQEWFDGVDSGILSNLAVVVVHRPPVWSAAQAAWGDKSPALRVTVRLPEEPVRTACQSYAIRMRQATERLPHHLALTNAEAWAVYRGQQPELGRLLAFTGVTGPVGDVAECHPPLRGDLSRWVLNHAFFESL